MKNNHSNMNMKQGAPYGRLAAMVLASFMAMYALMYVMVDAFANVYHSVNQVYMVGLMAASMVVLEFLFMSSMYMNKKINAGFVLVALVFGIACFAAIRQQSGVSDKQFLRSMIPHHAGAILMCREASIQDPEIKELC